MICGSAGMRPRTHNPEKPVRFICGAKIRAGKPRRLGFSACVQIFPLAFEVVSIRPVCKRRFLPEPAKHSNPISAIDVRTVLLHGRQWQPHLSRCQPPHLHGRRSRNTRALKAPDVSELHCLPRIWLPDPLSIGQAI